jgi:hypothetical protein
MLAISHCTSLANAAASQVNDAPAARVASIRALAILAKPRRARHAGRRFHDGVRRDNLPPEIDMVHFHMIGIYETFTGPDSIPHRPIDMGCIERNSTLQNVIVPLLIETEARAVGIGAGMFMTGAAHIAV